MSFNLFIYYWPFVLFHFSSKKRSEEAQIEWNNRKILVWLGLFGHYLDTYYQNASR